jgi:hypothetical protein
MCRISRIESLVGSDLEIIGYAFPTQPLRPGSSIEWVVWWRARHAISDERSVFVHLLNDRGEVVGQYDGPPTAGRRPTSTWQANDLIVDMRLLQLPSDLPPGNYHLRIGMYHWPSLERLPMRIAGIRQEHDALVIPFVVQ